MLYKISAMGYFGGVAKVSRGPWFKEFFVEDDGMDWFYTFLDNDGNKVYLLSNNMEALDREQMSYMYSTMVRNNRISWLFGAWMGMEAMTRHSYLKSMAMGWRIMSFVGLSFVFKNALMGYSSANYNPVVGAFLRKYTSSIK
jgi:hypothetical protein